MKSELIIIKIKSVFHFEDYFNLLENNIEFKINKVFLI